MKIKFIIFPKTLKHHLIYAFMIILLGTILFWAGRNNNDVCRNELKIESMINRLLQENNISWRYTISETNHVGHKISLNKCHSNSLLYLQLGSLIMLFGGVYFGINLQKIEV